MTNDDSRTGSFWDRHNKLMQDPEHEARFNTELARIRAVDAEVNANDDLRTALTKLREMYLADADDQSPAAIAANIDALLAAHPAPETDKVVDELAHAIRLTVEYVGNDILPAKPGWSWFDALSRHRPDLVSPFAPEAVASRLTESPTQGLVPAPVSDTRREDVARALALVDSRAVDEAAVQAEADAAAEQAIPFTGRESLAVCSMKDRERQYYARGFIAARIARGATRG